jgi:hypothetical protein
LPPDPSTTLNDLSRVRNLPLDAPVEIQRLDDQAFLSTWRATSAPRRTNRGRAFWSAFTMTSGTADVTSIAQTMLDENLDGFYDVHTKRLYVRNRAKPAPGQELTLAHEEEHALQDRFFGIPEVATLSDADEALAVRAMFEGDATLSSVVLDGVRKGSTSTETIGRIARLADNEDALLLRASGLRAADDAPRLLRAEIGWPYARGATFAAQLAASGGWALVDEAIRNPPKTTEQVLHIEKYIAGEGAIDVRAGAAPQGYAVVERGRMGELRTRFVLAECVMDRDATEAARGWGGDAYTVVARGSEQALLWSTAWDDVDAATRFATALEARSACSRTGPKPPFSVVRDGANVAFVQGLDGDESRNREAAELLALVGRAPPLVPPLGQVQLRVRPPVAEDFAHGDVVGGGKFAAPLLGLTSDLADLRPVKNDVFELSAVGEYVSVAVTFRWAPPSLALNDAFAEAFAAKMQRDAKREPLFDAGTSRVELSWTTADARTIRIADRLDIRFVFAPACEGKMTFFLVSAWKPGTYGSDTADAWLKSVHASDSSPACDALKTLRDPSAPRR